MRKWRPPDVPSEWTVNHQIVVPKSYRHEILSLALEMPISGHLGVKKTYHKHIIKFLIIFISLVLNQLYLVIVNLVILV